MVVTIEKNYPNPVNVDALIDTVKGTYPVVSQGSATFRVHEIAEANQATVSANLDTIIAAHNPATLTATQQNIATDNTELANLLAQAATGLTQIEADIVALQAAATLVAVRPIVDNILTRQRQIIRTLRGIVRSKLS